ncbi:hypothetical protein C8Q74DRAFT_1373406 [Fomes fomentarius]|nr:hypothetical protein C8Q74DRAFT_1373406 [Fomes fomentarius]
MTPAFQHAFYVGNNFNAILYVKNYRRSHRLNVFLVLFSSLLLLLNTVYVSTEALFGEQMWITNKDYPGGQDAYVEDFASVWYQTFGTTASIVLNLTSDALLIYRCYVIWADVRPILFSSVLYLATFATGLLQLVETGRPRGNYFFGVAKKLGIAYTTMVISNELILTALICARIIHIRRWYDTKSGWRSHTGAISIVVESALPCTLFGLAYLITFALATNLSVFFLSVYAMFTCISPQMIILRVISGHAWSLKTTETILSSAPIDFCPSQLSTGFAMDIAATVTSSCEEACEEDTNGERPSSGAPKPTTVAEVC